MMNPSEQSENFRALFEAVLEINPPQRAEWLISNCKDVDDRRAIERLIAADGLEHATVVDDSFDALLGEVGKIEIDGPPTGTRIGGFTLLDKLGEGGSSLVFLAHREQAGVIQRVALKLLRRNLYTPDEQRRFRDERRALSQLDHPGIARLIEGGLTDSGTPYIALELVEGETILEYARTHTLGTAERLTLFVAICRAVEAAHRALIVHRDLKPSNVLVTARGEVKLLDFGIAKLLDSEDIEPTQNRPMTPAYAAPEQFAGGQITTATDVYALGVMLTELITGRRHESADSRTPSAQVDDASAAQAQLASARALRRRLRGDLDNIVLKAMAAEPQHRYASAGAFAEDVERHLRGQPVIAHPPSNVYRARKFIRRHRGGVAITAAFLLAVFAALAFALWQARAAQRELARAGEVQAFVEQMFEPLEDGAAERDTPSLKQVLARGVTRIEKRYPDNLEVRANLLAMFARINDSMGATQDNLALSEAAWRANVAAFGADDARSLSASRQYGNSLRKTGKYAEALDQYLPVRDEMRKKGTHGGDYARILDVISMVRMHQGISGPEAIALKQEVLREREAEPNASRESLSTGYNNLGAAYQYAAQLDQALIWYRKAYAVDAEVQPNNAKAANALVNIGHVESFMGRWLESRNTLQQALAMYHLTPVDRNINLVSLLIRLCAVDADLEDIAAAKPICDQAVAMALDVGGQNELSHAMALTRRAGLKVVEGDLDAASTDYDKARSVIESSGANQRFNINIVNTSEARLWLLTSDYVRLRDAMLVIVDEAAKGQGGGANGFQPSAGLQAAWAALACLHAPSPACGDERAAAASRKAEDPRNWNHPLWLATQIVLAKINLKQDQPQRAIDRIHLALGRIEPLIGHAHSWVAEAHLVNERAQIQLGNSKAARLEHEQAAAIIANLPNRHPLRTEFERMTQSY